MNKIKTLKVAGILMAFSMNISAQDLSFNMEVTTPKSQTPMVMKVSTSASKIAMEPTQMGDKGNMKFIIDNASNKKFMLMENNGQKMAMSVDPFIADKAAEKIAEPKVVITQEYRTIDGYKCNKVIAQTEETTAELWLTQEAGLSYNDLYKIFNSTKGTPGARSALPQVKDMKGFPIEIISKEKSKDGNVVVKIKNISRAKVDPKVFSMDGYKQVDMTKKASQ